jgi:hypothetical protein
MTASKTDKFRKLARKWSGTIGSGGIVDDGVTSWNLTSGSGLPTDTGTDLALERVDANGTKTPALEEVTTVVVAGDAVTDATRGVEGTAQGHSAGKVVESLWTAKTWNDAVDGILVAHNQDGTHKSGSVFTLPQINDTTGDHQYITAVSELTADRTVTLPLLTGNDEFVFKDHVQTLTNKTLTLPTFTNGAISFNAPQGFLINGKIVPSVASNNLTVAIKGMDGNNPSSTNPVYVRIGDTIRSITAALSVTKNAGTNWFNAGSAELATKGIDYFVYLGYNATDGVVIGFSRIPYATLYSDFSTTSTNEKYCAISTITNAAAGDNYENIGRFAATLSAGAGYTWSVPTFTAANLIQRPIYESRNTDFGLAITAAGGSPTLGNGTFVGKYRLVGRTVKVEGKLTWGSTTSTGTGQWGFQLPFIGATAMGAVTSYNKLLDFHVLEAGVDNYHGWLYSDGTDGRIDSYYRHIAANIAMYDGMLGPNVIPINGTAWSTGDVLDFWGEYEI